MVNSEINFTVTAREFTISLCEIEISRYVHYCSNSFHYAEWKSSQREIEDRENNEDYTQHDIAFWLVTHEYILINML